MMKIDPYKHEERYFNWKEKTKQSIPEISKENSCPLSHSSFADQRFGTGTLNSSICSLRLSLISWIILTYAPARPRISAGKSKSDWKYLREFTPHSGQDVMMRCVSFLHFSHFNSSCSKLGADGTLTPISCVSPQTEQMYLKGAKSLSPVLPNLIMVQQSSLKV